MYRAEIESEVNQIEESLVTLRQQLDDARVLSNNTRVLRSPLFPQDFIVLNGPDINNQWWDYPLNSNFKVDTDNDVLITTDARLSSVGVLIQLSYTISGPNGRWYPGEDDGMFLDRRFGSLNISGIGRQQLVHFVKLPRGEYNLQVVVRPIPDVLGQGLAGVSEVAIGVRGL